MKSSIQWRSGSTNDVAWGQPSFYLRPHQQSPIKIYHPGSPCLRVWWDRWGVNNSIYVHPLFLRAHTAASKKNNPGWHEASRGKFADDYWKAMEMEVFTLESIEAWDVVEQEYDNLGVQGQALSEWSDKEIQSQILCSRRPAAGSDWLFWDLRPCGSVDHYTPDVCWKYYLVWNLCKATLPVHSCTPISRRTKMYMSTFPWVSHSMERMARKCALISKSHSMGYVKVLEHSGNTSQSNSKNVAWNSQSLIHACLLDRT